jgi:hypothetical protein
MDFIKNNINTLKKSELNIYFERIEDLIEDDFIYNNPPEDISFRVHKSLVNFILYTNDEKLQFNALNSLYKWAWFPSNYDFIDLAKKIDYLIVPSNKALALRVLIASGEKQFLTYFNKYIQSDLIGVSEIAKEGIECLKNK